MSDEQEVQTESPVENVEAPTEKVETTVETTKPEGWDQVDFTEEQQQRFNKVYKDLKVYQKEAYELRKIAKDQFDAIEQLRQHQNQVVTHLQNNDFAQAENILKAQKQEALNKGDLATYDDITDKLNEIKIKRELSALEAKKQPVQQPIGVNGTDVVTTAVQRGSITQKDAEAYRDWANETDDYGNLKRPWVNAYDHRNSAAAIEGKAVFSNPSFANKTFAEKLGEIDRRMGVANRNTHGSNVLPAGNLTRAKSANKITLSERQEKIALKTKFAGPGKTPQEHLEAYKKQIASIRGQQ